MKNFQKLAFAMLLLPLVAEANCGAEFCSLNTDWDIQGVANKAGVRLDVRAEYINLDQLRQGSNKTKPAGELNGHDELRTINHNYMATLDWNINPNWGISVKLPLVDRAHKHIHNEDDGAGGVEPVLENWDFTGIGDIQALGRYRFYADNKHNAGLRFGLQLPTGSTNKSNGEGELAERTLQLGTGSVDTLLGAYYNRHDGKMAWFAQGMWQQSVHQRDDFKPGRKLSADVGLSYNATPNFSLLLQLNALHKSKDSGANAEPADSGGHTISVSPGASYRVTPNITLYGFVQKPLVQYVNGTQLTADWSLAIGLSALF